MKNKWLTILIIITLILGIFFRFANLDKKVYSADEVRSILRLSGYTSDEFKERVLTGNIITASEIQRYQIPTPERNLGDALNALKGNPEHPPLYHLLTRFWMQIFNTPIASRIFSIILSILALPCIYFLCQELFGNPLSGLIAIAILAVSPFQIHAAQNTTQYSFWTINTLVSSLVLLRALRLNDINNWLIYGVTVAIGFYTHLFYVMVAFSHATYVFIVEFILEKFKITKKLINYCLASIFALLLFSPWLILILTNLKLVSDNTFYYRQFKTTVPEIIPRFFDNLANVFIDFHHTTRIEQYLGYIILIIIGYSLYLLYKKTEPKIWLFVLTLIIITPLIQILPNFISPSARPLQTRYYLPCYLGIQIAISYAISYLISAINLPKWQPIIGKIMLFITLSLGIISGIFITQIDDWGLDDQKGTGNGQNAQIAPIINQAEQPLVISEATHSFVLGLSYLVKPNTKFILLKNQDINQWEKQLNFAELTQQYKDIFIYFPDEEFLNFLEKNQNLKLELLELKKKNLYKVS